MRVRAPRSPLPLALFALALLGCGGAAEPSLAPLPSGGAKGDGAASRCVLAAGAFRLYYTHPQTGQHIGSSPDGDTIWFAPDDAERVASLGVELNKAGFARMRLQGVDALELHYQGSHQHEGYALAARDELLRLAGFDAAQVAYSQTKSPYVLSSVPERAAGHILITGVDRYGRALAFLFRGPAAAADGANLRCDAPQIRASLNAELLRQGLAYPYFGSDLPAEARAALAPLVTEARAAQRGVWLIDRTLSGFGGPLAALEQQALLPLLYRRLHAFFHEGNDDLARFPEWLAALDEPVIRGVEATQLSALVELDVSDGRGVDVAPLRLSAPPEQLVFIQ